MEFKQLIYFKKVAELEHITKAADELIVSESHLSRIISELENDLGVKLFDRKGRGIQLNPCGFTLYKNVLNIINSIDEAKKQVKTSYQKQRSQLTVITNVGAYFPGLLKRLSEIAPDLNLKQYSAPRNELIKNLGAGTVDFAICCPPINDELQFTSTILHTEAVVVIYPKNHWLEGHKTVSLKQLKDEAFVSVVQGYGARDAVEVSYSSAGILPNIIIETGDTIMVFKYVYEGLGIALVPKSMTIREEYFKNHYADVEEPASSTVAITWTRNKIFNEFENIFYNISIEYFRELSYSITKELGQEAACLRNE